MDQLKGLWTGYADGNATAPHAKNYPWYIYRNYKGPVQMVIPEPKRSPQVYNRWTADPKTKAILRWCNKWLFFSRKSRAFLCVLTAFTVDKFWTNALEGIVSYNNLECTMEYAINKEKEWADAIEAEKARRRALGLPEEDEEEEEEEEAEEEE